MDKRSCVPLPPADSNDSVTEDDSESDGEWQRAGKSIVKADDSMPSAVVAFPIGPKGCKHVNTEHASTLEHPFDDDDEFDSDSSNFGLIPRSRDWTRHKSPIEKNPKEKAKMQDVKDSFSKSAQHSAKEQFKKPGPQSSVLPSIPDRVKLEQERLARQRKRSLDLEIAGLKIDSKRARTSHSPAPSASAVELITAPTDSPFFLRRFETGGVLPTLAVYANPRADGRDAITLPEIIGICADGLHPDSTLELAILSTYKLDYDWLAPHFPSCLPVVMTVSPPYSETPTPSETARKFRNNNWVRTHPAMPAYAILHSKIMLLLYKSGRLRVVISTANLRPLDWGVLENAVFIQDVILKPRGLRASDGSTAKLPFNPDEQFVHFLERILEATNVERALKDAQQTHKDLRLKTISDLAKLWDWRGVRAALVHSIPGKYHDWKTIRRTGHPRLMCALKALNLRIDADNSSDIPPLVLECGSTSVPFYTTQWLNQLYVSAGGSLRALRKHMNVPAKVRENKELSPYPPGVEIVFPTRRAAMEAGGHGAKSLFSKRKHWATPKFPKNAFRDSQSRAGSTLMHTKMIIASFSEEQMKSRESSAVGWMYVGSHNFTQHAWGTLTGDGDSPMLSVNNFEVGVVLPLETAEELDKMSPWQRPAKPYAGNDSPWIPDENKAFLKLNSMLHGCSCCVADPVS
ncbi:tyrosyl-DNA phosphodiesterase-domain-containing protein [Mycena amicta]|nr:tyrosyl-DNA phosphodiesterase-domain-containing protein [Mycena amicta]